MKIGITAPVYVNNENHKDFLDRTTKSFASARNEMIFIPVENFANPAFAPIKYEFTQQPTEVVVLPGRQPQSVAKAWNDGIQKAIELGCDYVLVINADIVMKSNAIDRLVAFAEAHPEFVMWSMGQTSDLFNIETCEEDENWSEHPNFSAYMVRKDFFDHVGKFDENFIPAYFEDNDMHARLALAGKQAIIYGGARFFHFGSRTANSDPELKVAMPPMFRQNQIYFMQKWGRPPLNEVSEMRGTYFQNPFCDPTKTLKDW